jgi:hypothetical protein
LFEIANNCLNLKNLNLDNCTKITNNGLFAVAKKCVKLKELNCYCDGDYENENENVTFCNLNEIVESFKRWRTKQK